MTTQQSPDKSGRLPLWDSFKKATVRAGRWVAPKQKLPPQQETGDNYSRPKTALMSSAWKLAGIGLLGASVVAVPLTAFAEVLFRDTFDNGIDSGWARELCCDHSAQIVSSPVRSSSPDSRAIKFTYRKTDYLRNGTTKRAELKLREYYPIGSERWYKFSMYIPTTWQNTKQGFIINQFGQRPDDGEEGHVPALFLVTDGQKLRLGSRWDPRRHTTSKDSVKDQGWDLGSLPKGRWVDMVYHVKWSYGSDGILEVYKDGEKVVSKQGPNCYNDESGVTMKLGLYASGIRADPEDYDFEEQVIYYDAVQIADSSGNLLSTDPTPSPTPKSGSNKISESFSASSGSEKFTEVLGDWSIKTGEYVLSNPRTEVVPAMGNISVYQSPMEGDFALSTEASVAATESTYDDISVVYNYKDRNSYYYAAFSESKDPKVKGIFKVSNGKLTQLTGFDSSIIPRKTYKVKVEKTSGKVKVYLNDKLQGTAEDSSTVGMVGLATRNDEATFDNLAIAN